jgi:hypothetical protein
MRYKVHSHPSTLPTSLSYWYYLYYGGIKTEFMHISDLRSQSDCSKVRNGLGVTHQLLTQKRESQLVADG